MPTTRKSKVGDSRENMGETGAAGAGGAAAGGAAVAPIEESNTNAEPMSEQKEVRSSPQLVTEGKCFFFFILHPCIPLLFFVLSLAFFK